MNYYNENDPKAAAWLHELICAGLIPVGEIDTRSIVQVEPSDLKGYRQCHFFAGIGGWAYALQLAEWPEDRPVWTGSCPCQPFSQSGKQKGFADARHLWPEWMYLIAQCKPSSLFGEQVSSPAGLAWFDFVSTDLEGEGYVVGASDLCAAGVGAPHLRQRLYFVGHANSQREHTSVWREETGRYASDSSEVDGASHVGVVGDFWSPCDWVPCRDGKSRPVEPGTFPLAHGLPARMGRLRGYGNAIVPPLAAEFIKAYLDVVTP